MDPLASFSPATRGWFERTFDAPTPPQVLGWPAIATREHVLIQAPTGSGKTLTAFMSALDRLNDSPGEGYTYGAIEKITEEDHHVATHQ